MTKTPKTILLTTVLGAVLAVGGVAAEAKPGKRAGGAAKAGKAGKAKGQAKKCAKQRKVGFVVKGTFVSGDAVSVTLKVTKANRHALKSGLVTVGDEYTATPADPAKIRYVNRTGPGDAQATDKVRVIGKVTALKKGCPDAGFTPTATVRKVKVIGPEVAAAAPPDLTP